MAKIVGVVLAGGQGMRMGGVDKALLLVHRQTLLAHVLRRLTSQVAAAAVSANGDPGRFAEVSLQILPDAVPGQGPLAGVLAGLTWAEAQGAAALLTVPVDTPFIPVDLAARLAPAPAAAAWRGRAHHLVALWPVAFRPALAAHLASTQDFSVRRALALAGARYVDIPAAEDPFLNLNTPEDVERAAQAYTAAETRTGTDL